MASIQPMQSSWNQYERGTDAPAPVETGQTSVAERLLQMWLLGMLVLLPLDLMKLPLGITLVDLWILMALPVLWLTFLRGPQVISLSYTIALWVILISSFASTFAAPAPRNSLVVIVKEIYAFIWFVTLAAVFARLQPRDLRRILMVWSGIVFLHGLVILAQFVSPSFWRFVAGFTYRSSEYEIYRPSGLFLNANSAAFFQLLGFVPLVLVSPSPRVAMILGVLLLPTMLATGSMGATVAFVAGLTVAVAAVCLSGHLVLTIKFFAQVALILLVFGGLLSFVVSHNPRYREHFEHILLGRADRSSDSRFDLWRRGTDVFLEHGMYLWGVGPENFREVDGADHQLHNDFMAFLVERGVLGVLGLVLFAALATGRAAYLVLLYNQHPDRIPLAIVVFLAAMVATLVESITHQMFHFRTLWLVLALQEAMLFKTMMSNGSQRM